MKSDINKGYVYILINPAFKDNWVKIGMTSKAPDVRASDLDNTAVPVPYEVYATLKTAKYKEAETFIHRMIDRLTDLRIRPNREFFNISPEEAYGIFEDISKLFDDAELNRCINNNEDDELYTRRSNTTFEMLGIKPGELLTWWNDTSIEVKVVDSKNRVEWNGDIYAVSGFYHMMRKNGKQRPPSKTTTFQAFCRKGDSRNLNELRMQIENS